MAGEGGAILTDNEAYATTLKQFRQHGMSAQYDYVHLGYNYRMSDLHAAVAIEQLKKANTFNAARQKNAAALTSGLHDVEGLVLPQVAANRTHVYNLFTIRITEAFRVTRDALLAAVAASVGAAGWARSAPLAASLRAARAGLGGDERRVVPGCPGR